MDKLVGLRRRRSGKDGDNTSTLVNEENEHDDALCEIPPTEEPVQSIILIEVKKAMELMKNGKSAGGSRLNIDLIRGLGEIRVDGRGKGKEMVIIL